ncbi:hypothetical protein [Natronobacterium gregoryi]|uniref:Uncharacterized protein n=2 Tax=Natronobacterium gregoryi TaxID=44930 RepID=L0ADR2_NATGS|nr:hypothetical protein [Natronobacterium gregoryi]AFZ71991.1 hypothetical protein Natgr_0749 [Natronobacterium gregoryi SP2]ELY62646.1 hypothetical protein C490_17514 [Natronobacterium gregoryi SP2]PLK20845.1 hypothetical protein CYV19_07125 [Natronobacterium gregoryi SP2]SFJ19607.1 hypothetical protein SAMN05443661_11729 [Natronobacterium gregoryi]
MTDRRDRRRLSRRTLLRVSAGTVTLAAAGSTSAVADGNDTARALLERRCPEATLEPSMGYCEGASTEGCADDHPATIALQQAVRETLETEYPNVGTLVDAGFKPYFDTLDGDDDGWSHWLSPEYIGDDAVLDPDRPESVLVDNTSWRSIGVMFIATRDGERIDPPPVYDIDEGVDWMPETETDALESDGPGTQAEDDTVDQDSDDLADERGATSEHEAEHEHEDPPADDPNRCSPWHYHTGAPGRFAWWFYQQAYEQEFADGNIRVPCRTPCMMHVWTVDHPEGVYAHDGPPPEYREQPPADDPGFETDARPGEDELDWDLLPEEVTPEERPESVSLDLENWWS